MCSQVNANNRAAKEQRPNSIGKEKALLSLFPLNLDKHIQYQNFWQAPFWRRERERERGAKSAMDQIKAAD